MVGILTYHVPQYQQQTKYNGYDWKKAICYYAGVRAKLI